MTSSYFFIPVVAALVVIGPRWVNAADDSGGAQRLDTPDDQARVEIETALQRGLLVVPVRIDGAVVPSTHELTTSISELAHRNGVQIRHDPCFHSDMIRLIAGLRAALRP